MCSIHKVAALGLNLQDVGADLSAMFGGNYVNRFNISGRAYKVIPQIKRAERLNPSQLEDVYVTGPNGKLIPLSTVATIREKTVPRSLNRLQQLNAVTVSGASVGLDQALKLLKPKLPASCRRAIRSTTRVNHDSSAWKATNSSLPLVLR